MSIQDPAALTHAALVAATAHERVALVETFLLAAINALHPETIVDPSRHLADLGIDSLQVVELKFSLDQVLGQELDVELIISNPTVAELAVNSIQAAGF